MSYTDIDNDNADKFADVNQKIRLLQLLQKKAPHLTSHLQLEFRDATDEDYHRPASLKEKCKVLNITIDQNLCDLLSCNITKEKDLCKSNDIASYYYLGDDQLGIQCQPACFNTKSKQTYDEHGNQIPNAHLLNYFQNECRYVPEQMATYLEKPFYRSDVHYERRINDMPTGYSRFESNNIIGSGYDYKINATYCKYFDLEYIDEECEENWWELGIDYTFGYRFLNTIRSTTRVVFNHGIEFKEPENLPIKPTTLPTLLTLDGWKNNINKDFVIPELIDTTPHKIESHHINNERNEREQYILAYEAMHPKPHAKPTDLNWNEKLESMLNHVLNYSKLLDLIIRNHVYKLSKIALKGIKSICIKIIERMTPAITNQLVSVTEIMGSRVLAAALRNTCIEYTARFSISIASRGIIFLAKSVSLATSIVGWFLLIGQIFDFIFTFYDPFGYNNLKPKDFPQHMMEQGERVLRRQTNKTTQVYDFDELVRNLLTPDEIDEISILSFTDRMNYFNALTVNSDGEIINKGDRILMNGSDIKRVHEIHTKVLTKHTHFDASTYEMYNSRFLHKAKLHDQLNKIALGLGASSICCLIIGFPILCIFLAIVTLFVLSFNRIEIQYNLIDDVRKEWKLKI